MQIPDVSLVPDFSSEEREKLAQMEKAELIELLVKERQGWKWLIEELEEQHLSEWEALERDLARTLEECSSEQKNWASTLKALSEMFSRPTQR